MKSSRKILMVKSLEKNSTRVMYDTNLQGNSNDELGAVPPLEEVSKRVLYLSSHTAGLYQLQELWFDIISPTYLFKHRFAFLQTAALYEAVGSVHHHQSPQC